MANVSGNNRGHFPAVPFTFDYTYGIDDSVEITWKGRGRYCKELTHQIDCEKRDNDGVSVTEQALMNRDPRKAAQAKIDAEMKAMRLEAKAKKEAEAEARRERQRQRQAAREARAEARASGAGDEVSDAAAAARAAMEG